MEPAQLVDTDRLMLLINSAESIKASTNEVKLHYYTFFAKVEGVPFIYDFQVLRSLYSTTLHDDLKYLEEGEYLKTGSDFHLADKGKKHLGSLPEEAIKTQQKLTDILKRYAKKDELTLFKEAYAKITKGLSE